MKTVLITGGAGGIGRALIAAFEVAGYRVLYSYHRQKTEQKNAIGYYCDLSEISSANALVAAIKADGYFPDVVINNAGLAHTSLFQDLTDADWMSVRTVNLDAPMAIVKGFLPEMIRRKSGAIINISSMWGQVGGSCEVGYSAAKAGLIGFTKALAKEIGPSGITVNCIAPGVIDTPMNAHLTREDLALLAEETPMGRLGKPEEVADLAVYLASGQATFITGQVLAVNGGLVV